MVELNIMLCVFEFPKELTGPEKVFPTCSIHPDFTCLLLNPVWPFPITCIDRVSLTSDECISDQYY